MTDRELLELAAKAACVKYDPESSRPHPVSGAWFGLWIKYDDEPSSYARRYWNPLADDGDALRLAVRLRIAVEHNHPQDNDCWVSAGGRCRMVGEMEDVDGEVIRRAIVRAAAEIGKAMP